MARCLNLSHQQGDNALTPNQGFHSPADKIAPRVQEIKDRPGISPTHTHSKGLNTRRDVQHIPLHLRANPAWGDTRTSLRSNGLTAGGPQGPSTNIQAAATQEHPSRRPTCSAPLMHRKREKTQTQFFAAGTRGNTSRLKRWYGGSISGGKQRRLATRTLDAPPIDVGSGRGATTLQRQTLQQAKRDKFRRSARRADHNTTEAPTRPLSQRTCPRGPQRQATLAKR